MKTLNYVSVSIVFIIIFLVNYVNFSTTHRKRIPKVCDVWFFFFFLNCKCLDDCIGSIIWYVGLLVVIDLDASAYTLWIWNCNVLCERKIIFNSIMSITFSSLDMLLSGCWLWGYHHCFPERDRTLQESYLIIRGYDASDHDMLPAPWVFCLN